MQSRLLPRDVAVWTGAVLLGLLGLGINFFKTELFFNVDFLFGGIFVMLAVKFCGRLGILSAFIASIATYVLWNHPYAIIIFTAEAAFVRYSINKGKDVIISDIIYWMTAGALIIFITYHFIMDMPTKTSILIILKQSINGVFNTVIASIIYHVVNFTKKSYGLSYARVSFKIMFFKIFVLLAFIPSLIYIIYSVRADSEKMSVDIQHHLRSNVDSAVMVTDHFIKDNYKKQKMLGDMTKADGYKFTNDDVSRVTDHINSILSSSDSFFGLGLINNDYTALTFVTKENGKTIPHTGSNFKERDYYSDVRQADEYYISDVYSSIVSKIDRRMIIMLTPLKDENGSTHGFIQGGIDFQSLRPLLSELTQSTGVFYTLTDRRNRIIISTNPSLEHESKYIDPRITGDMKEMTEDVYLWSPLVQKNVSYMTRWMSSMYIASSQVSDNAPIHLIGEYPIKDYVSYMNNEGFNSLIMIAIIILASTLSAMLISSRISYHLSELSAYTSNMPDKVYNGEEIKWPSSIFSEINSLIENFREMQHQLYTKFFQLKQQTQELNLVFDSIPLLIFLKDTNNNVIFANKTAADMLGRKQEEMSGCKLKEIFPNSYDKIYEHDLKVIETGEPVKQITQNYTTILGERTVLTDKIPILGPNGHVESILIISQDITDELKASEERQKTLDTLYQQSKMAEMGAMIAAIAHQWKQPLNAAGLITQMIQSDADDGSMDAESLKANTALLMDNIEFMSQTMNDFIGYFKQNKEKQVFRPCETVREIYTLIDRQFIKHGIEVVFHPHEHFEIASFRNEFKQVCLNILNNAKEALIESGIQHKKIDVRYEVTDREGVIIISDNAGGIAPELLPDKLFEPYNSTKGESGTGIGLYICKNIMENHIGGTITAHNDEHGAVFTIHIPL